MRRRPPLPWIGLASLAGALLALLLAPTVHERLAAWGWAAAEGDEGRKAFLKVVRRGLMLGAGLPWALALCPWREVPPAAMGFVGPRARPRLFAVGFAATLAAGLALLAAQGAAGWWRPHDDLQVLQALGHTGRVLLVPALLVAIFEEMLFRGWLEGRQAGAGHPLRTAVAVSAFYALLHAFRPRPLLVDVTMDIAGAFEAVGTWAARAVDPVVFGPSALGFFLFGLLLSAACRRTGTVWTSIGIHAAGITLLQAQDAWLVRSASPAWAGTGRLLDGAPGWAVLALAAVLVAPRARRPVPYQSRSRSSGSTPGP